MITSYLENNNPDRELHVPELTYAYNTAVQESTGSSPAFLNWGKQPASSVFFRRREERGAEEHPESANIENWHTRMLVLPDVQQIAADNATKAQKRQARYYYASRRKVRYNLDTDYIPTKSGCEIACVSFTSHSANAECMSNDHRSKIDSIASKFFVELDFW